MQPSALPVVVDRCYDLWLWIDARVSDFRVEARHGLGQQLRDASFALLDALVRATFAQRGSSIRVEALDAANHRIALLRLTVRGARDRKLLSLDQHAHAAEQLAALGRMVSGWLRVERARATSEAQ